MLHIILLIYTYFVAVQIVKAATEFIEELSSDCSPIKMEYKIRYRWKPAKEDEGNYCSQFDEKTNTLHCFITINLSEDIFLLITTIFHEFRHAYQNRQVCMCAVSESYAANHQDAIDLWNSGRIDGSGILAEWFYMNNYLNILLEIDAIAFSTFVLKAAFDYNYIYIEHLVDENDYEFMLLETFNKNLQKRVEYISTSPGISEALQRISAKYRFKRFKQKRA